MRGIPLERDIEKIYACEERAIDFLFEQGALDMLGRCQKCDTGQMAIVTSDKKTWRCDNYKCGLKTSIFKNSFFARSRLQVNDLLRLCYKWVCGQRFMDTVTQTGHSSRTVSWTMRFCRELVEQNLSEEAAIIGGDGVKVEVDESKFGKVKYGHGHRVEGAWVLGGVELTAERRMFLRVVPDRKRETLVAILRESIAPGTIIVTDLWKGYANIENEIAVTHMTVNHSRNYKDPETGAHTNTIEGTWAGIKCKIAPRNRTQNLLTPHLCEFIWRRQNSTRLWDAFLDCLKNTKYV